MSRTIVLKTQFQRDAAVKLIQEATDDDLQEVVIRQHKSTRSYQQNRYYWKCLNEICDNISMTVGDVFGADDMHDRFRKKFLPYTEKEVLGEMQRTLTSTKNLPVDKMAAYITKIDQFCSEHLGLWLPQPGYED